MALIRSTQFALLAALLLAPAGGASQETPGSRADLAALFSGLTGTWECEGATASGLKTGARITISPRYDGAVLLYEHLGLVGHTNRAISIWAFDTPNSNLVVARHFVTPEGNFADSFVAERWEANQLTLVAKATWQPLWAPNRFQYLIRSDGTLSITWEVFREDWEMGDYLDCARSD